MYSEVVSEDYNTDKRVFSARVKIGSSRRIDLIESIARRRKRTSDSCQVMRHSAVRPVRWPTFKFVAGCVLRRSQQPNGRLKQPIAKMWKGF